MTHEDISMMLSSKMDPVKTIQWLRCHYLRVLVDRFNTPSVQKRLGLYQGERIPDNERNLTDVRNRVSLIIEYELARLSNELLEDFAVNNMFWSYVVANRFPDLEVRCNDGARCLRIEVKCLQSIAEEKSANFDTLKKDINPKSDFVVVFLWEWSYVGTEILWDRAPKIHDYFVFNAYSLAELRDHYWLNRPPSDLGDGYQGFDLRYAVNCKDGVYAEEEGNYGKLLRIWKKDFRFRPKETAELLDTEKEYIRFQKDVIMEGFWNLCEYHLPRLSNNVQIIRIDQDSKVVGAKSGDFGFFSNTMLDSRNILPLMLVNNINYGVVMTDKYASTGYGVNNGQLNQLFRGLKPKNINRSCFNLV